MKKDLKKIRAYLYEGVIGTDHFPWVDNYDHIYDRKAQADERRMRILTRGMKIGQKKGAIISGKMSIFDTKSKPGTPVGSFKY